MQILLALLCFFAPAAQARIPFTTDGNVIVNGGRVQAVIPTTAGTYRMYYVVNGIQVLSAVSANQVAWALDAGVRLSTVNVFDLDGASITALGVMDAGGALLPGSARYRMYYVGLSTAGQYSVLSATSTDGLSWGKESGIRLQLNGGRYIDSPRPLQTGASALRLYFAGSSAAGNNPNNFHPFMATSADLGLTFGAPTQLLNSIAFQVAVTSLTDSSTRLYYSSPLSGSTVPVQIVSALAPANSTTFSNETGVRLSTVAASATLQDPVLVRGVETFRWHMFETYTPNGSTTPFISSALTQTPVPLTLSPASIFNSASTVAFTVTGEIFSSTATLAFSLGSATLTWTTVNVANDMLITGTARPFNQTSGSWTLVVTNSDGKQGSLAGALLINIPPGIVTTKDNLFHPGRGEKALISVQSFDSGRLLMKIFTIHGEPVVTIVDTNINGGVFNYSWDGKTSSGNTVASGVYILKTRGPHINTTDKIVVIK